MSLYVTRCKLDVAGQEIEDFKLVSEKARILRKMIPLMYKTGSATLTQRFSGELDYVVPKPPAEDLSLTMETYGDDSNTTLYITYDGDPGVTVTYSGVHITEIGDATVDGENELIKKVHWIAESRTVNGVTSTGA